MTVAYVDSSAIVKLAVRESESARLRTHLRRRSLVSSALARTEVMRALLPSGEDALDRGREVLRRIDLVRVNNRILDVAGTLRPSDLRSLDAIHLATARQLAEDLGPFVTYDERMSSSAKLLGFRVVAPR